MDVDELEQTIAEAKRLMSPNGTMIVGIVHPMADMLRDIARAQNTSVAANYFETRFLASEAIERNDQVMTFRGWTRPLSAYVQALKDAGLAICDLLEPQPSTNSSWQERANWTDKPLFLWMKARAIFPSNAAPLG